jgi:hypothetical protein
MRFINSTQLHELISPLRDIYTLRTHQVCTNSNECEEDVHQLDGIGEITEHFSKTLYPDLKPFTETTKALKKVSLTIQDSR